MRLKILARFLMGLALATAVLGVSCSMGAALTAPTPIQVVSPTVAPATLPTPATVLTLLPTSTPTLSPTRTMTAASPTVSATPVSGAQLKLDLDSIFPAGPGRDLVLNNCTICHTFLRIVVGQRTKDQWEYVRRDMRNKVSQLSDRDVDTLFTYLEANFNDAKPVPDLPDWFLQTGEW